MSAASRFLFDTRFDVAKGATPPAPPRKSFTPAELDAAKAAAHQAGLAAGRAAATKEVEARIATAIETLVRDLDGALAAIMASHETQGREGVMAAAEMVRRLFPAFAARAEFAELEALLADCLARLADEPRVVLRLADGLVEAFKPRLDGLLARSSYAGRVVLLGDPALGEGQARIEWADGGVERDAPRVWAEIDQILQQHVAGLAMPDATPP